jgi:ElaB/YqjD/DUF883 family membrane-anchored ribosome-binding protein
MDAHIETSAGQQQAPDAAAPPAQPPMQPPPIQAASHAEHHNEPGKIKASDWVMVAATIVIACGTVVSAIAIYLQWREMVNGGADTAAIKVAAQQQATAAQQFADTAKLINGGIQGAVDKLNLQADALNDSVKQASRLAKDTEIANANSLVADRPWLAITISITDFVPDKTPMKDVTIINSGKRPALITNFSMGGEHFNDMVENPPYEKQIAMRQLLVPGTHYDSVVKLFKGGILTAPAFAEFDSGRANYFSYAKVEYTDIGTGKTYYTHTCVQYRPATTETSVQFISCIAYNYGD